MISKDSHADLLQPPPSSPSSDPAANRIPSSYHPLTTYNLPSTKRTYTQQFSDLYFSRLTLLKPSVTSLAAEAWADFRLGDETAQRTERVLDVRQGELCWVVGTCFMEMPLKPNVLEDVGREHWIAAPVAQHQKFFTEDDDGAATGFANRKVMLEDESGRLRLTGEMLDRIMLVTGAIVAVLGTENRDGEFEVLDVKVPDLPRQPQRWEVDDAQRAVEGKKVFPDRPKAGKIALISGLGITGEEGDTLALELLSEWLLGEAGGSDDISDASRISRLIVVGNSLAHGGPIPTREELAEKHISTKAGSKKYGYDSSTYNPAPTDALDNWLAGLLPSIPITLLPGDSDPAHAALPQQPVHAALFPRSRAYMAPPAPQGTTKKPNPAAGGWFDSATNPFEAEVDGWRLLATGGQPVEDMSRYVPVESRAEMMEAMLRWRLSAPTCPDTLWCYPFQSTDAFVITACPHLFVAGNQLQFETTVVHGPQGRDCRVVAVPKFKESGEIVLLDAETLEPEVVKVDIWTGE
ncbi:hypothetical protein K461DRAFT_317034 [Myriangium duriaei CBS 260.36]|uniref:DNA-directed DNA polymerase n=1 Tax=Myriangium duriaei CBS 260.36 TaxID=1168546 RepID=A0A9P4JDH3_9PEZI|nr:hypothetical protein K461DRAFT_317034 [Myriangium duriaei CBS 260.36]